MYEYHVVGFSDPVSYAEWVEDMNEDFPGYVIDSVIHTGYGGYGILVTFHFEVVLQSEVNCTHEL